MFLDYEVIQYLTLGWGQNSRESSERKEYDRYRTIPTFLKIKLHHLYLHVSFIIITGSFYQPDAVIIDIDTLDTLPVREFVSGIAEVIKYGLIRDAEFFNWQEKNIQK